MLVSTDSTPTGAFVETTTGGATDDLATIFLGNSAAALETGLTTDFLAVLLTALYFAAVCSLLRAVTISHCDLP